MRQETSVEPRKFDRRLVLPALSIWFGMWLISGWRWGIGVVGIVVLIGCLVLVFSWFNQSKIGRFPVLTVATITVLMGSCVLVGGLRMLSLDDGPLPKAAEQGSVAKVDLSITTSRTSAVRGMVVVEAVCRRATIAGQTYRIRNQVVILVPSSDANQWQSISIGSLVAANVKLSPGEYGRATVAVLKPISTPQVIRPPPFWKRIIESIRAGLVTAMQDNPEPQAALLPGLVVGDTSAMSVAMNQDFQVTGLTHVVAVSGVHLVIILGVISAVSRRIGLRGYWLTAVSVLSMVAYVALCYAQPSVVRAAAMAIVSLMGASFGGANSGIRGLCLSVMVLCWYDPWMSRSIGFVLSAVACVGIILWGQRWTKALGRWLPDWLAEVMAVALAAQVATQPIICWLSGRVSVAGLIANVATGPWVAPAIVIGLIAALVSPLSPLVASWIGYIAGWCSQPILSIVDWLAALPGASHPWPVTPTGLVLVSVACLVLAWVIPRMLSRAWIVLACTMAMVATMLVAPYQPGWPDPDWQVASCDVGQGDATVVRVGQSKAIVLDVGPEDSGVMPCLSQLGVKQIPLMVLSHFHEDHVGAFEQVVNRFPIASLLVGANTAGGEDILRLAKSQGIEILTASVGEIIQVDNVRLTVISAWLSGVSTVEGDDSPDANDESLIVRLDTEQMSLLCTGDVELTGQRAALRNRDALDVDVIKVPHHGSARQEPAFLKASQARIALVSVGAKNTFGHPAARTIRELTSNGMTIVRTDQRGSITLTHNKEWKIITQK